MLTKFHYPKSVPWCDHQRFRLCRKYTKYGLVMYRVQCVDCLMASGQSLSHKYVYDYVEDLNDIPFYTDADDAFVEETRTREQAKINEEWWDKYNDYLQSAAWHLLRENILKRDGGICRACLVEKADHVHHLTYENVFHEKMDDLISLCYECHQEEHTSSRQFIRNDAQ